MQEMTFFSRSQTLIGRQNGDTHDHMLNICMYYQMTEGEGDYFTRRNNNGCMCS